MFSLVVVDLNQMKINELPEKRIQDSDFREIP